MKVLPNQRLKAPLNGQDHIGGFGRIGNAMLAADRLKRWCSATLHDRTQGAIAEDLPIESPVGLFIGRFQIRHYMTLPRGPLAMALWIERTWNS